MRVYRHFYVLLAVFVIAGCASSVDRRDKGAGASWVVPAGGVKTSSVSISLNENARKQHAENQTFSPEKLLLTVRAAMSEKGVLPRDPDPRLPWIEIYVKDIRIRSTFSAVMLGILAGTDSLSGEVILKEPGGRELQRFTISASYGLGGFAGGQDDSRMGWLYDEFARLTLVELIGQPKE